MELQYDGTGLHGWAKQEGLATVEGCLQEALGVVLGSIPALQVAGRTDAGVHARRQVVSLDLPAQADLSKLVHSLNALTPAGIAVTRIVRAPKGFDARKAATSRTYRYFLSTGSVVSPFWSRYCWHRQGRLDGGLLKAAAQATLGKHDFTAFTPAETEHVFFSRTVVRCKWRTLAGSTARLPGAFLVAGGRRSLTEPGMFYLEIAADAFLRHMVRALVGTMVEVGEGRRGLDDYLSLLAGAGRGAAGATAPAQGLFFWDVKFGGCGTRSQSGDRE